MTTLAQLADQIQTAVSDAAAATWTQATIEGWLNKAIRDYSDHFNATTTTTLTAVADTTDYTLPDGCTAVLSVEVPATCFLKHKSHARKEFYNNADYYDVIHTNPPTLRLSAAPPADTDIIIWYTAVYNSALSASDAVTVPERHWGILEAHVIWQALRERQAGENQNPYRNMELLTTMTNTAVSARTTYETMIADAKQNQTKSAIIEWDWTLERQKGYTY